MSPVDQDAYRAAYAAAQKQVRRGHVIDHVRWRDGHLDFTTAPIRNPSNDLEFVPQGRRSVLQGELI